MFTRKSQLRFSIPKEYLVYWLNGNQVKIRNLEFEVMGEEENSLQIVPVADQENEPRSLPVTRVVVKGEGNRAEVLITSEMGVLDTGGHIVAILFSCFLVIAGVIFYYVLPKGERFISYIFLGLGGFLLIFFYVRMYLGYFGYVRKLRRFVKGKGEQITRDVRRQIFKHKV